MELDDIKEVLSYGKEKIRSDPRLFILWRNVYNENFPDVPICGGCGDGFGIAYDYMSAKYYQIIKQKKQKKMNPDAKFVLKNQGTINCSHGPISNDNLTDEIAIELLQSSENYIHSFAKFPPNWKELVANTPTLKEKMGAQMSAGSSPEEKKEGTDITTMTKAQLQDIATKAGYPEKEWSSLNRGKLLDYLTEKNQAEKIKEENQADDADKTE